MGKFPTANGYMDNFDKSILRELQRDADQSIESLAGKVRLSTMNATSI